MAAEPLAGNDGSAEHAYRADEARVEEPSAADIESLVSGVELFLLTRTLDDVPAPLAATPERAISIVEKPAAPDMPRLPVGVTVPTRPRISVEQPIHKHRSRSPRAARAFHQPLRELASNGSADRWDTGTSGMCVKSISLIHPVNATPEQRLPGALAGSVSEGGWRARRT
jgi:hypothetical protein